MDIHKGLLSNWSKHLFLIFFIVLNSSCINNKNFVYYDGIYESPRHIHIPNTVFSDEMKLANDMANLNFEEATITTNKNQYREDYSTTNTYVYLNNNIDPYWNSRWEYRFWSLNNGWNGYGWNGYGWNGYVWNSPYGWNNFYNPYSYWGNYNTRYNNRYNHFRWQNSNNKFLRNKTRAYRSNSNSYRKNRYSYNNEGNISSKYYNNNGSKSNNSYRRSKARSSNTAKSSYTPKTTSRTYNSGSSSGSSSSSSKSSTNKSSSNSSSYRSNSNSYRRR